MSAGRRTVVALSGGIGGAKLALGLSLVLDPADLVVVANTGDDFQHLGLSISPDIDTVMYTLAGLNNPVTGWGRRDETWRSAAKPGSGWATPISPPIWSARGASRRATPFLISRRTFAAGLACDAASCR